MSDDKMWSLLSQPLQTGAQCISELCFSEVDRRGVGLNRVFAALIQYLEYQMDKEVRLQNSFVLKDWGVLVFTKHILFSVFFELYLDMLFFLVIFNNFSIFCIFLKLCQHSGNPTISS